MKVDMKISKPVAKAPAPKPASVKPPSRIELVNATKAAAGHRQFQADYVAKAKGATGKAKEDFETLAATHKDAAEAAEKTLARAPKKS